jgi:transposase InsO family protein
MPWRDPDIMNQRTEFVLRTYAPGEVFQELCEEYGISAKTGYKWKKRFEEEGRGGLRDRSRRPKGHPEQLSEGVICEMVRLKLAHQRWGPRKIRDVYQSRHGYSPSESSFKRVLDRAGLVERRRRRRRKGSEERLTQQVEAKAPNDIWTVDFKGWWWTNGRQRCEPLTIRDDYSRYLLGLRAMTTSKTDPVRAEFEKVFERYGLPGVIRSDNGPPFASMRAPLGLSRLSVWWVQLGIELDRIAPGHPEQNGGHERMHLDIRRELQGMIEGDLADHQASFDVWRKEFNEERPHEALGMKRPADVYHRSSRGYSAEMVEIEYPPEMVVRKVGSNGMLCIGSQRIVMSKALAGTPVALKALPSHRWEVWLDHLRLGEIDVARLKMEWAEQPPPSS